MGLGMKVVQVKMQWGSKAEEQGLEMEINEAGVRIERCNDHIGPWS